jgi:hypothetical protein
MGLNKALNVSKNTTEHKKWDDFQFDNVCPEHSHNQRAMSLFSKVE